MPFQVLKGWSDPKYAYFTIFLISLFCNTAFTQNRDEVKWLAEIEYKIDAGFQQVDAATVELIAIACDTSLNNALRWKALQVLSQVNTYMADSFLIAHIDRFNFIGEPPGSAGGEIDWMYPCFGFLSGKSSLNFTLVKPILGNLHTEKTENELFFIKGLLMAVFSKEESVQTWIDVLLANAGNFMFAKNLESIRVMKWQ